MDLCLEDYWKQGGNGTVKDFTHTEPLVGVPELELALRPWQPQISIEQIQEKKE